MPPSWPIPVVALKPVSCGSALWRAGGAVRATVVIKATFGMVHDGTARLVAPAELVAEDRTREPGGCLEQACEVVPYLPSAGVVLTGHAHAPAGRTAASVAVRLGVLRERPLLDKTLNVFGDRAAEGTAGRPFDRMPLVYERAFGGPGFDDNPAGTGAAPGARGLPNVVDGADPRRPAGFGPIARRWGARRRLLGGADARAVDAPTAEIPDGLDWRYFHAAPADQQVEYLRGDEWIVLDGLHPALPRLQTRLPSVHGAARWYVVNGAGAGRPIDLCADMLIIDAERQVCSVVWRGSFALESADAAGRMRVFAGIELPGYPIAWPEPHEVLAAPSAPASTPRGGRPPEASPPRAAIAEPRPAAPGAAIAEPAAPGAPPSRPHPLAQTSMISAVDLAARARAIAPFALAAPGARRSAPGAPLPGAPWSHEAAASPPPVSPGQEDRLERTAEAQPSPFAPDAGPPSVTREHDVARPAASGLPFVAPPSPGAMGPLPPVSPPAPALRGGLPFLSSPAAPRGPLPVVSPPPMAPAAVVPAPVAPPPMAPPAVVAPPAHLPPIAPPLAPPLVGALPPPTPPPLRSAPPRALPPPPRGLAPPPLPAAPLGVLPPPRPPGGPDGLASDAPPLTGVRATLQARARTGELVQDLELAGADLRGLDLHGAVLSGCNLKAASLQRCNLEGARLVGAQLAGADLAGANLAGADLTRADLSRAVVSGARFDGAKLDEIDLSAARGAGATFVKASGKGANLARGFWEGASFRDAELPGADLTGATLTGAGFQGAALAEARLDEARGDEVSFEGARLKSARATGATFKKSSFAKADASGSSWEKAALDDSSFEGATLTDASFLRATFPRARFAGADAGGADLQRVTADGADFAGARLEAADLRQARLRKASFEGALMSRIVANKVDLAGARLVRADLTGAVLRAARLSGADLTEAVLEGADLRDADLERAVVTGAKRATAKLTGANTKDLVDAPPGGAPEG